MKTLVYLLSIFSFGNALPATAGRDLPDPLQCDALIENTPWHVSGITVFNALQTAPTGSSIHFHVSDTNPRLEFETNCGVSMPSNTGSRPEDAKGWHPCDKPTMRFQYTPGNIRIQRLYKDDCLGEPPYNHGIFYGNSDTQFEVTKVADGELWTQTELQVPITSQT